MKLFLNWFFVLLASAVLVWCGTSQPAPTQDGSATAPTAAVPTPNEWAAAPGNVAQPAPTPAPTPSAPADPNAVVTAWDTIQVDYVGKLDDGSVFDTSLADAAKEEGTYNELRPYAPLPFTVWAGMMIPGFDKWVVGMKIWEKKTIEIPPADWYGELTDQNIEIVPADKATEIFWAIGQEPTVGETYTFGQVTGKVKSITDGAVEMEINHFLAGKTLTFEVEVKWITKPSAPAGQ